jgi:putative transposase
VILSHKIELDTTFKQRRYFASAAGCARLVWNVALAEWDRQYKAGEKPSGMKLKKEFNGTKYEKYPWMKTVHRDAHAQPFANLDKAFKSWFKGISKRPTFKKKGRSRDSFAVANDKFRLDGASVVLPKIGRVRLTESLRFNGKIMGAVVSRTAGRWFIAIQVDVGAFQKPRSGDGIVGVDLGIKVAATLSTGEQLQGPKPLKVQLKKLARANRELSRRQKGSANRRKTKLRLSKIHARIANIRKDWLNKLTTTICKNHATVVIEDLHVRGMVKNRRLARSVSDMGFGEFSRQLVCKSAIYSMDLVIVDRWFPSSKMCSSCGHVKKDLTLRDRTYECDSCGLSIDRDLNAALNLSAAGLAVHAHGRLDNPIESNFSRAESVEVRTIPCPLLGTI